MSEPAGTIVHLQICPAHRAPMERRDQVKAIGDLGLEGDRHAKERGTRQVLLVEEETLTSMGLGPGEVRENITTRGIALMTLEPGTRLRAGGVLLEITKACTPCERMDEIRTGLQSELEGRRGMLAHVVEGGEMHVGDVIRVEA